MLARKLLCSHTVEARRQHPRSSCQASDLCQAERAGRARFSRQAQEGIKHGRDKARDALRGMFNPVGGGGASGISQRPTKGSDAGGAGGNTTADGNTSRAGPVREASSG